jgi:hypothetical protein
MKTENASAVLSDGLGPGLRLLTNQELCIAAQQEKMCEFVRAEVCRRLERRPQKANYLTFRWLLPSDEANRADAFDGLVACCWNATQKRVLPFGLFPFGCWEDRSETVANTRDKILTHLVHALHEARSLNPTEIVRKALNTEFSTDADVANAVRRALRSDAKYLAEGDSFVSGDEFGYRVTLVENLSNAQSATSRASSYASPAPFLRRHNAEILRFLGKDRWKTLWTLVHLNDSGLWPDTDREQRRVWTEAICARFGVGVRQARTYKARLESFLEEAAETGHPVMRELRDFVHSTAAKTLGNGNGV